MSITQYNSTPLEPLLIAVGRQLSYLNVVSVVLDGVSCCSIILHIFRYCRRLEHLGLHMPTLLDDVIEVMIEAFDSGLGRNLISLDLDCKKLSDAGVELLSMFLANRTKKPELRQLRLIIESMHGSGHASLRQVLLFNRTLRFITPMRSAWTRKYSALDNSDYDEEMEEGQRIQEQHWETRIQSELPLVFLSVVQHESSIGSARHAFGSYILAIIFKFAAIEVRRRVFWEHVDKTMTVPYFPRLCGSSSVITFVQLESFILKSTAAVTPCTTGFVAAALLSSKPNRSLSRRCIAYCLSSDTNLISLCKSCRRPLEQDQLCWSIVHHVQSVQAPKGTSIA